MKKRVFSVEDAVEHSELQRASEASVVLRGDDAPILSFHAQKIAMGEAQWKCVCHAVCNSAIPITSR